MNDYGYNRRGFRFRWFPILLVFLFLMMFTGGFHHGWFFFWPLFFVLPFIFVVGGVVWFLSHLWHNDGPHDWNDWDDRDYSDHFQKRKPKHGDDSDSDIFYV